MKKLINKLETICNKYCNIEHQDNYSIGGGLSSEKFASRRHEDAKEDDGKLTLGQATQLFKRATGLETDTVRAILEYAVPNMEWHHAGLLPKVYGGGMKKTYFVNAHEICDVATNWNSYTEKLNLSKITAKNADNEKKNLEVRKLEFLQVNAKKFERVQASSIFSDNLPKYNIITSQEMDGKYGWFNSCGKHYNMPEYYSGWSFENEQLYNEFLNIK